MATKSGPQRRKDDRMTGGSVWKGAGPRTVQYRHGRSAVLGPITSSHSRIKSRIVIPYSSCIIIRYIGEYSAPVYRIIPAALLYRCANSPHDPAYVYPFFLSIFRSCPSFCLPRLFRSSKWKHLGLWYRCPGGKQDRLVIGTIAERSLYIYIVNHNCSWNKTLFLKRCTSSFCAILKRLEATTSLKVQSPLQRFPKFLYYIKITLL